MLASVALRLPHRFGGHGRRHRLEQAGVGNPAWLVEIEEIRHLCPDDESGLRHAIDLAHENVLHGTGRPFGAVVVDGASREVIGVGVDGVERLHDSVAHAEIVALLAAEARSGRAPPPAAGRSTLYCSCEPCALCLTAILASGVGRVVYAARREDAVGSASTRCWSSRGRVSTSPRASASRPGASRSSPALSASLPLT